MVWGLTNVSKGVYMLAHMDISVFGEISDIDKFLIISGIFVVALIIQHFYYKRKDKKKGIVRDESNDLLTTHADLD